MKINKTAVAVKSQDAQIAEMLSAQYGVCEKAKDSLFRESMKFGALLIDAEQLIGECKGGYGSAGEGIKAWLEEHCPQINYNTAMGYKAIGAKAANMLGGGRIAIAALLDQSTIAKTTGEVIDVPSEVIKKRDALLSNIDSRRKLEQAYFAFMAENGGGKAGGKKRTKGLVMPEEKAQLSAAQFAHAKWSVVIEPAVKKCARLVKLAASLTVDDAQDAIEALRPLMDALRERVKEG